MTERNFEIAIKQANNATNNVFKKYYEANGKAFNYEDTAIMGIFDEAIEKCETILFLVNNNKSAGAESLVRVVFEHYVYLKYILISDTEKRGKAYILNDTNFSKVLFDIMVSNSKEGKDIRKFLELSKNEIRESAAGSNLSKENIEKLKQEYLDCFSINKPARWYDFDGNTNNFHSLCKKIDLLTEYNLVYRIFSRDTHASKGAEKLNYDYDKKTMFLMKSNINKNAITNIPAVFLVEMTKILYNYYGLDKDRRLMEMSIASNFKFN